MRPERPKYLQSLAAELASQAQRIRSLIGSRHWPTDGAYKESLLSAVIRRHCPSGICVARGFVVSDLDPDLISREQDILIVDTLREAPIFLEAGIVITVPRNVLASVSVKSTLRKDSLDEAIENLCSVRKAAVHPSLEPSHIWCGVYSYDYKGTDPNELYRQIEEAILGNLVQYPETCGSIRPQGPDCIVGGLDFLWTVDAAPDRYISVRGYRSEGMAPAILLAHLLTHISSIRDRSESDLAGLVSETTPLEPREHRFIGAPRPDQLKQT